MMKRGATFPKTLREASKYFSDLDTCTTFMAQLRWPEGVTCPHCEGKAVCVVSYLSAVATKINVSPATDAIKRSMK